MLDSAVVVNGSFGLRGISTGEPAELRIITAVTEPDFCYTDLLNHDTAPRPKSPRRAQEGCC